MKKMLREIFFSKLLLITFLISLVILVSSTIKYQNNITKENPYYSIVYHDNIEDYEQEIINITEKLNDLDPRDISYDFDKWYLEKEIQIYNELKSNNISYSSVMDQGYETIDDRIAYMIIETDVLLYVILLNMIVVIYLIFTREFDSSGASLIYSHTRYKIVLNKLLFSALVSIGLYIIYFMFVYIFSKSFNNDYSYVLVEKKYSVSIVKSGVYIFTYIFMQKLYFTLFAFILMFASAIFLHKSLPSLLLFSLIAGAIVLMNFLGLDLITYFGLELDCLKYSVLTNRLSHLSIIIPISLLGYGIYNFEYQDLL